MMCVYMIRNRLNGRFYIGSTKDLATRKGMHLSQLSRGIHNNKKLQADYLSKEQFEFIPLEVVEDASCLLERESIFIKQAWDNGDKCYNVEKTADKSTAMHERWNTPEEAAKIIQNMRGSKTVEGIEKNKEALRKLWADPIYRSEQIRKISEGKINSEYVVSEETKALKAQQALEQWNDPAIKAKHMAIRSSKEYRAKLSAAKKTACASKCKCVTFVDPKGIEHTVSNIKDFAVAHGLSYSGMYRLASGKFQQCKGWTLKQ